MNLSGQGTLSRQMPPTRAAAVVALLVVMGVALAVTANPARAADLVVTSNADSGEGSLRAAVATANGNGVADNITFNLPEGSQTITLTTGEITFTDTQQTTIDGGTAGVTVSGNNASRVFNVNSGNLSLKSLTVSGGNVSGSGGGINNSRGTLAVTGSTISGNAATGGGIGGFRGTLSVTDSTISGNEATGQGGGIFSNTDLFGMKTTVENSTISGNTAGARGGGVNNDDGLTTIRSSTITNNTAPSDSGAGVASLVDAATSTEFASSIVTANSTTDVDGIGGTTSSFVSQDFNLIGDGNATGAFNKAGDRIIADDSPGLGPLADNNGPTMTHALLAGSPALDAAGTCTGTDQRGFSRPQGSACDIGAFENIQPRMQDEIYSTNEDTVLRIGASSGVLANDTDADNDTLSAALVSGPAHARRFTLNQDGSFTYTPNANFNGTDTFTYKASDGKVDSDDTTVNITVTPVNDAPSFTMGPNQTIAEDSGTKSVAGWATAISAGPPNESGQSVSFTTTNTNNAIFATQPAVSSTGTLTFKPKRNASGSATVTVRAKDDGGTANRGIDTSAARTFTITVTPVNDAPVVKPVSPVPGSTITNKRPVMKAKVSDIETELKKANIKLFVDGASVSTFSYDTARDMLTHTPAAALKVGSHTVKVVATDAEGETKTKQWSFKVS